jgi:hypothetical protein
MGPALMTRTSPTERTSATSPVARACADAATRVAGSPSSFSIDSTVRAKSSSFAAARAPESRTSAPSQSISF